MYDFNQNTQASIQVKAVAIKDVETLHHLACDIWIQYYPSIIGEDQVNYMLAKFYNLEYLKTKIEAPDFDYYFIGYHGKTVGYIGIKQNIKKPLFWSNFYIHPNWGARGLGVQVFNWALSKYKPKTIHLTVNRHNIKAINFYFKLGFKITEVANFDIGKGYVMEDFVMAWHDPDAI